MSQFPGPQGQPSDQPEGYGAPPPTYQGATSVDVPVSAAVPSMVTRLLARLIDSVILAAPLLLIRSALLPSPAEQVTATETASMMGASLAFSGLSILLVFAYEVVQIALRGATLGKQLMKIKVVQEGTGQVPGFGPALLRWLIPFAGVFACLVGMFVVYISPFFDKSGRLQGWHDKVAHTQVVSAR